MEIEQDNRFGEVVKSLNGVVVDLKQPTQQQQLLKRTHQPQQEGDLTYRGHHYEMEVHQRKGGTTWSVRRGRGRKGGRWNVCH